MQYRQLGSSGLRVSEVCLVAVRWMLDQHMVASAIVGARNAAQLTDTLAVTDCHLPDGILSRLDAASALPRRYPRAMEDGMAERREKAIKMPLLRNHG